MTKFLWFVTFSAVFSILLTPITALADTLINKSGTVTVSLTINPSPPIVGEIANFSVEFFDSTKYFTLKRCICTIKIKNSLGGEVFETPLLQDTVYLSEKVLPFTFTFPKIDTYTIEISGVSTNKVFETFVIKFEQKIENKYIAPWIVKTKQWFNTLYSDVLPVILVLVILPLGWKFLVVGKRRRR